MPIKIDTRQQVNGLPLGNVEPKELNTPLHSV